MFFFNSFTFWSLCWWIGFYFFIFSVFIISIFLVDDFSYYFMRSFCLLSFQYFMLISTNQLSYSYDILWMLDKNEKEASIPRNSQCLVVLIQCRKVRRNLQKAMEKIYLLWLIAIWNKYLNDRKSDHSKEVNKQETNSSVTKSIKERMKETRRIKRTIGFVVSWSVLKQNIQSNCWDTSCHCILLKWTEKTDWCEQDRTLRLSQAVNIFCIIHDRMMKLDFSIGCYESQFSYSNETTSGWVIS